MPGGLQWAYLCATALLTFSLSEAWGQFGFGPMPTSTPLPGQVSVCEASPPGFYEINWRSAGASSGAHLELVLPDGARFAPGSREDLSVTPVGIASTPEVSGDTLRFALGDLPDGAAGTVRFRLLYDCAIEEELKDDAAAYSMLVRAISADDVFEVPTDPINSTASFPSLEAQAGPRTDVTDAVLDATYRREVGILQAGQQARTYSFELCMDYGPGARGANQVLSDGTDSVALDIPATGGCVTVSEATHPTLAWPLDEAVDWSYAEDVTVVSCDARASRITLDYRCGPESCQIPYGIPLTVALEDDAPTILSRSTTRTVAPGACLAEGSTVETEFEVAGRLYDLEFITWGAGYGTEILPGSLEVDFGDGTYEPFAGGFSQLRAPNDGCGPGGASRLVTNPHRGPVDAVDAARTVRIRYRTRICDEALAGCELGELDDVYPARTWLRYADKCGVRRTNTYDVAPLQLDGSCSFSTPASVGGASVAELAIVVDEFEMSDELRDAGQACFTVEVDSGLEVVEPVGGARWRDSLRVGEKRAPLTEVTPGVYEACFPVGEMYASGTVFEVGLRGDCGAADCGDDLLAVGSFEVRFGDPAMCPGYPTAVTFSCDTAVVKLHGDCCPALAGVSSREATLLRTCYGAPDNDNDGCADPDGAVDLRRVFAARALPGDELEYRATGVVATVAPGETFATVTHEIAWPGRHEIASTYAAEVFDASTGGRYRLVDLPVVARDTLATLDLDPAAWPADAGAPAGFRFAAGDSIALALRAYPLDNPGCGIYDRVASAQWYAERDAGADERLEADAPLPARYELVGYELRIEDLVSASALCAGTRYDVSVEYCVGGGDAGAMPFPFEVRDFGASTMSTFDVPEYMTLASAIAFEYEFTRANGVVERYTPPNVVKLVDVSAAGGTGTIDWGAVLGTGRCDGAVVSNGGYNLTWRATLDGACLAESLPARVAHAVEPGGCAQAVAERSEASQAYPLPTSQLKADLALTSTTPYVVPSRARVEWPIRLEELRGIAAGNAWVAFASPSGDVTPLRLVVDGAEVAPTSGVYRLGDVPTRARREFVLSADYSSCGLDSVVAYTGWECDGYPPDLEAVLNSPDVCQSDRITLYVDPADAQIQQAVVRQPLAPTEACTEQVFEVGLINAAPSEIFEPVLEVYLPFDRGVEIVPGSPVASYPAPRVPADTDFDIALGDPVETTVTPIGIRYVWDLDALIDDFDAAAARGWPGRDGTETGDRERLNVRFTAVTNCNFVAGDFFNFVVRGRTWCGAAVQSVLRNTERLDFVGVSAPYAAQHTFAEPDTFDACTPGGAALAGAVTFFGDTDGGDSLQFVLPEGLAFAGIEAERPGQLASGPRVRRIPTGGGGYLEEVTVGVAAGIPTFTAIRYALRVRPRPGALSCAREVALQVRSVRTASYACAGATCGSKVLSGVLLPPPTFPLDLDDVAATGLRVRLGPGAASVEQAVVTLANDGVRVATGPFTVTLYADRDGDGFVSPGDRVLGSETIAGEIPPGGALALALADLPLDPADACRLVAGVEACTCGPSSVAAGEIADRGAGPDLALCPTSAAALGEEAGAPDGTTYRWAALGGAPATALSDVTDARPTFDASLAPRGSTLRYERTTRPPGGGCARRDTVAVTIDDRPEVAGPEVRACVGEVVRLGGPVGHADYAWTPANAVDDPSDPATSIAVVGGSSDLALSYRMADGCEVTFRQRVVGDSCALPALAVGAALRIEELVERSNGNADATYRISVGNAGRTPLELESLSFPLAETLGEAFVAVSTPAARLVVDGGARANLDPEFDGRAAAELLAEPLALDSGATAVVVLTAEIAIRRAGAFPTATQVVARARGAAPASGGAAVTDRSDSGSDPRGRNPGAPGDTGGSDDPTPLRCASVGTAIAGDADASCAGSPVSLHADAAIPPWATSQYVWSGAEAPEEVLAVGPTLTISGLQQTAAFRLAVVRAAGECLYDLVAEREVAAVPLPNVITPNGDGVNDVFAVDCLESAAVGIRIEILSRWGERVYVSDDYDGSWGGTRDGEALPPGTYFYVLTPNGGGGSTPVTGYIEVRP